MLLLVLVRNTVALTLAVATHPCLGCSAFLCWWVQAARLTLVQILMAARGLAMNPLQSLYYVSPACFLCLLVPFCE